MLSSGLPTRLMLLTLLVACGEDQPSEAARATDSSVEDGDGDVSDAVDEDGSQYDEEEGGSVGGGEDRDPSDSEEDGDVPAGSGTGAQANGGADRPVEDAGEEQLAGFMGQDLGGECHTFDFDRGIQLVRRAIVVERWPDPAGGTIVPGSYELVSEERFVDGTASEPFAADCVRFDGLYFEKLMITDSDWLRLNRYDNTVGRERFRYRVEDGKVIRDRVCPALDPRLPPDQPLEYTASADQLVTFDALPDAGSPGVCRYRFTYKRKP